MIYLRPLAILFFCVIGGAMIGGLAGYFIGEFAPQYYISVFNERGARDFDPARVGGGLGVSQGLVAGVVVGLVTVVTVEICSRSGKRA